MNTYRIYNLDTGFIIVSRWFDARFIYESYRLERRITGTPADRLVVVNVDTGKELHFE